VTLQIALRQRVKSAFVGCSHEKVLLLVAFSLVGL
jgi:hypothetical protein